MLKERVFDTGVVKLNYAEGPDSGPPHVLLHGGGDRRQYFLPLIPHLIQGDPSQGGRVSDEDVEWVLGLLGESTHVKLEGLGHNLGLDTWEVAPLLRAISGFLESL